MSAWQHTLEQLKAEALLKPLGLEELPDPAKIPQRVVRGWRVLLSYAEPGHFNLSVSLHPRGRSSTRADWETLGKIAKTLGAPKEPLVWPKDPNAPIHWVWGQGLDGAAENMGAFFDTHEVTEENSTAVDFEIVDEKEKG